MHPTSPGPGSTAVAHCRIARPQRAPRGLTLTEMLISVALLAVLTALAVPAYQEQQRVARRSDGQAALLQLQSDQVRWRSLHDSHTDSLLDLGWTSDRSPSGHYRIRLLEATAEGYVAQAIGLGGQAEDRRCSPLHLHWQGSATAIWGAGEHLDSDPNRCWRR